MFTIPLTGPQFLWASLSHLLLFLLACCVVAFVRLWCRCARKLTIRKLRDSSKKIRDVRRAARYAIYVASISSDPTEFYGHVVLAIETYQGMWEEYKLAKAKYLPPHGPRAFTQALFKGIPHGIEASEPVRSTQHSQQSEVA